MKRSVCELLPDFGLQKHGGDPAMGISEREQRQEREVWVFCFYFFSSMQRNLTCWARKATITMRFFKRQVFEGESKRTWKHHS